MISMKHSYWDDFWGLRGWRDGARIAQVVHEEEIVPWCHAQYEALKSATYDSIRLIIPSLNFFVCLMIVRTGRTRLILRRMRCVLYLY